MKSITNPTKRQSLIAMVLIASLVSGCGNYSFRYPSVSKASLQISSLKGAQCNAIPLYGVLRDPDATDDPFIEIRGQVVCSLNCESSTSKTLVDVGLATKAEFKPFLVDSSVWKLSGTSVDKINLRDVGEEGAAVLNKSYLVEGRNDGLQLHLKFQITQARIELTAMWLEHHSLADKSQ